MTWQARRQKGKFRNTKFYLETASASGGRRLVLHEFPGKDAAFPEDLGKTLRSFSLSAFVVGADYDLHRNQLINELEKSGPGTLVHPYRGSIQVVVQSYNLTESTAEGGIAKFDISFVEFDSSQQVQPTTSNDTQSKVSEAADEARNKVVDAFRNNFAISGFPEFVRESAISKVQEVTSTINQVNGLTNAATSPVAEFANELSNLGSELGTLITQPAVLASRVSGVFAAIAGAANDVETAMSVYRNLAVTTGIDAIDGNATPSRQQEQQNTQALSQLQAQLAIIEMANASAQFNFESHQQAVAVRDEVLALLDAQAQDANDEVYRDLNTLRAVVFRDINARGADLSRIVEITPAVTQPALVLAYQLYGDVDLANDVVNRNQHITNPNFVVGGQPVEALSSD